MTALVVTLQGNLAGDPELRYTAAGKPVANFTVVTSKSYKDEGGKWQDKDTSFWRCTVWDQQAEFVAESFQKGDAVIAVGSMAQRSYETREGENRTVTEVQVTEVGASVKRRPVKIDRAQRSQSSGPPSDDPWASAGQDPFVEDEPPF